jgi:hypothetical protein
MTHHPPVLPKIRTDPRSPELRLMVFAVVMLVSCGPSNGGSDTGGTASDSSASIGGDSSSGSAPCSEVYEGDLNFCNYDCSTEATSDVESVRNIGTITGRLAIIRTDFVDLEAFGCIEDVEGLVIHENSELRTLAGLGRLRDTQGTDQRGIRISENPRLESLDGLVSLREVAYLEVAFNDALTSLSLNHVEHIGELKLGQCGDTGGGPSNAQGDNPSLAALDGFDSLVSLTTLSVSGQNSLASLDRLREIAEDGVEFTQTDLGAALSGQQHLPRFRSLDPPQPMLGTG